MNGDSAPWTIDRLARLAAAALAAGTPTQPALTQPNGRIREVPDVRTIRWYTSIGLLGRPAAMRGRTALYSRTHLAQLVAIKRLQAEGLTIAAVQERLLGADESAIEAIAGLPADMDELEAQIEATGQPTTASTKSRRALEPTTGHEPTETINGEPAPAAARARFWATRAATPDTPADPAAHTTPSMPGTPTAPADPAAHPKP
ncbi:helix-turn-helix domain-containing protein, partial [Catenulispora rubra]|uniref:helix-turn-helix domain-containing protein n=1 Tax=Catenulispora rubra TaxID=280293 RepID=UPI002B276B13